MEKNAKEKMATLKKKYAHRQFLILKGGLFIGFASGFFMTFCLFKALLRSERFSDENRAFYKARFSEIKTALCQIKAQLKKQNSKA